MKTKLYGNEKMGASVSKGKEGVEVQAGIKGKKGGVHLDAGYDKASKTAGAGVSVTVGGKTKNFSMQVVRR